MATTKTTRSSGGSGKAKAMNRKAPARSTAATNKRGAASTKKNIGGSTKKTNASGGATGTGTARAKTGK